MAKSIPVDLSRSFNFGRSNEPLRAGGSRPWPPVAAPELANLPGGEQVFWGIPFHLGAAGEESAWLLLDEPRTVEIGAKAAYLVVLHFCGQPPDWDPAARGNVDCTGEQLADYVIVYDDGTERRQPIRRRFEVGTAWNAWGQLAFAARPHSSDVPVDLNGPYPPHMWGQYQTSVRGDGGEADYWLYALANPEPDKTVRALRLEPTCSSHLVVAGLTLFEGKEHPLRRHRLESLRITLPEPSCLADVRATVDLGTVARTYAVPAFVPDEWLADPVQGWGEEPVSLEPAKQVLLDVSASADATLSVAGQDVPMADVFGKGGTERGPVRVELLTPRKTWVHVTVEDASTGRPTPVRVHFRAPDGRYLPPYGHRHQVNDNWYEDYGADLKLGHTQYAYVDGKFLIELPVGEVYVELSKGFEYRPLRQRLQIAPGQRELRLRIERPLNWRARGWVTADTHVHFISPQTAWLEAQGEGINLVNLLASQWGDLFTNVGDISGGPSGVSHDDTIVWVGTENRQHLLGHMSMLGAKGEPVFPMCAAGPSESYIGDPTWTSLAEWADRCRQQEGVVIMPHFPSPYGEVVADIVLGKVDGVEIRSFGATLDDVSTREWYRYLNCGYRVAAVGGTDKMWAGMPVGGVRTYADLGGEDFSFHAWAKAVRAGRTFTTSGPIIGLSVEGRAPGSEIALRSGGSLAVEATAESLQPFHTLEIVMNGKVVASEERQAGSGNLTVRASVPVQSSSWLAARCVSRYRVWHGWPVHIAAHTSPVYVVVGDERQFSPSDATFMLTMLDGGLTWLDTLSIPADAERHARIRRVFLDAKEALHQHLHAAGHGRSH